MHYVTNHKHIRVFFVHRNQFGYELEDEVIESTKDVEEVREKWQNEMMNDPDLITYQIIEVKADGSERKVPSKFHGFAKGGKTMNDKVSDKIRLLRKEGKPQEQAVAIALSMRDEGKLEKGGKISEAIDLAKEAVKAMSDEEVATTLVDVIFSSLDSLEVDTTEDEALAEARKDIEHSRNLLMNILDEAQTPAP